MDINDEELNKFVEKGNELFHEHYKLLQKVANVRKELIEQNGLLEKVASLTGELADLQARYDLLLENYNELQKSCTMDFEDPDLIGFLSLFDDEI
jgi:predicted nuclease with TOPRIM domain